MKLTIFLNPVLFLLALSASSFLWSTYLRYLFSASWILHRFVVNGLLLWLYGRGLRIYAEQHYFRWSEALENLNSPILDERIDELLIEITRHTVVFGVAIVFDIVMISYFLLQLTVLPELQWDIFQIIATVFAIIRELLVLQSLQLSFRFAHVEYERRCKCIDDCVKYSYRRTAKMRHRSMLQDLGKLPTSHNL